MVCSRASTLSFVVYMSARALGFEPVLYLYYDVIGDLPKVDSSNFRLTWTVRKPLIFSRFCARTVGSSCANIWSGKGLPERPEKVGWDTTKTTFNSRHRQYAANNTGKLSVETVYVDLCLECQGRNFVPREVFVCVIICEERDGKILT